jgi:hypothetical protein
MLLGLLRGILLVGPNFGSQLGTKASATLSSLTVQYGQWTTNYSFKN